MIELGITLEKFQVEFKLKIRVEIQLEQHIWILARKNRDNPPRQYRLCRHGTSFNLKLSTFLFNFQHLFQLENR